MAATSIRVRGVTYTSPDAAYVAAAELEDHAESVARNLRRSGKDGEADTVADRGRADAERLRAWARSRESAEANATPQPADAPKPKPKQGSTNRPRRRASAPKSRAPRRRARSTSSSPRLTPRTRSLARRTGIPRATSTVTGLALQVAGLTIGVAFLTLLLTDRGVSAFTGLAGGLAGGLRWFIDPVDPLGPRGGATGDFAPGAGTIGGGDFTARRTAQRGSRRRVTTVPLATGVA